jgi:ATP-binding cassette subfamily B protein RaxB
MNIFRELTFRSRSKLPIVLQTEAAECALACLAMISSFHGNRMDLSVLRRKHSISLKGATLNEIARIAEQEQLATRAIRLDLDEIKHLRLPCIIHWNFNHFVVLSSVRGDSVTIHDPAFGERVFQLEELSKSFTGVALELWPNSNFIKDDQGGPRLRIRDLFGNMSGGFPAAAQVFILAVALEVFTVLNPFFLQWVVDEAIVGADKDLLLTLALGFALILLIRTMLTAVRAWVLTYFGALVNVQWRANVFAHLIRLPTTYFHKRHLGDVYSRFTSIDHIQATLTTSFVTAVLDGIMSVITLVLMFMYSNLLGSVALGALAVYCLLRWLWFRPLREATASQIVFAAKQHSHFLESLRGVRAVKLFQREDQRRATWLTTLIDQTNAGLRTQRLQTIYESTNGFLTGLQTIAVVYLGAKLVLAGEFSVGALIAFKAFNDQFAMRTTALVDKLLQFSMLRLHGERLADILLTAPETSSAATSTNERMKDISIEAIGLRFRYSPTEPEIIRGLSFKISPNESVAIVGPSGCGKSTLINILLGVLEPTGGKLIFNDHDTTMNSSSTFRASIGTVLQDDSLFAGSIADNISFFDPQADHSWIEECARTACIHDEIFSMPMRYNSLIGDMGTILSGGQKQRVLLARALYKRPTLLILDEATSHLDLQKEREVNAAVKRLNITRIIVAHRPETIATADRILTLNQGVIERNVARAGGVEIMGITSEVKSSIPLAPTSMRLPAGS